MKFLKALWRVYECRKRVRILGVGRSWGRNLHWEFKSVFLPVREWVWSKCVSITSLMCLLDLVIPKELDEWGMVHMPGSWFWFGVEAVKPYKSKFLGSDAFNSSTADGTKKFNKKGTKIVCSEKHKKFYFLIFNFKHKITIPYLNRL